MMLLYNLHTDPAVLNDTNPHGSGSETLYGRLKGVTYWASHFFHTLLKILYKIYAHRIALHGLG